MAAQAGKSWREVSEPIILTENLTKVYGRRQAVSNVDLKVQNSEFLTIFGPNGAGKSTLIKTLSTIINPSSGKIKICGVDLEDDPIFVRQKIGIISHDPLLYRDLTAQENLRFYAKLYRVGHPEERIVELLEKVELEHRKYDVVRTFSRGMLQRLSVARALLHQPEILFLDEPHTGLDPHATEILDALLEDLKEEGDHTFIMTTHHLEKGLALASSVAILVDGRLVMKKDKATLDIEKFRQTYDRYVRGEEA